MTIIADLLARRRSSQLCNIVREGLSKAREDFAHDRCEVADVEAEAEFWLSVEDCEWCTQRQMCSHHFDRFYGGW